MRSELGVSTILHCRQWYELVLSTRLSTAAVQYLVRQSNDSTDSHYRSSATVE